MTLCLLVTADGLAEEVRCAHATAHTLLGGPLTFVGVIPAAQAVILALKTPSPDQPRHAWSGREPMHDADVRGAILICGSDSHGCEVDVDPDEISLWIPGGLKYHSPRPPNGAEPCDSPRGS